MKVHMQPTQDRGPHLSADRSGHRSGSIRSGRAGPSIDDGLPITGCLAAVEEPYRIRPGSRCPVGLAVLRVSLLGGEPTVAIVNGFYRPDARQHRRVPFSDYSTERFRFRPSGHRVGSRSARAGFRHPEVLEAKLVQPDRVQVSICRYSDDRITSKFQCVMVAYYASYQ